MQLIHNQVIFFIGSVLAVIFLMMGVWVYSLECDLKVEKAERAGIESALTAESGIIEANRVDYKQNLADANKTNIIIHTRYVDKIKVIEKWRDKDENVSCDDTINAIDNYSF